jgi:molecular chaperone GrpE
MAASKPSKKQDNNGKSKTDDTPIDQTLSAEPTEELNPDLEAELLEAKDQNLRLYAEFENFRRRTAKERLSLMMTAGLDSNRRR